MINLLIHYKNKPSEYIEGINIYYRGQIHLELKMKTGEIIIRKVWEIDYIEEVV